MPQTAPSRRDIFVGSGIIEFGGHRFYSKGDIVDEPSTETFDVTSGPLGKVDTRFSGFSRTVTLEPVGMFTVGLAHVIFRALSLRRGASIYGNRDQPLVIWGADGKKRTYKCAGITKLPNLPLKSSGTMFGSMTFKCIPADGKYSSDANSMYVDTIEPFPGYSDFEASNILTQSYGIKWGSNADDTKNLYINTTDGIDITPEIQTKDWTADACGLVDTTITDISVSIRFTPIGIKESVFAAKLPMQGADARLGGSLSARGDIMDITSTGVFIRLFGVALKSYKKNYSTEQLFVGDCEFITTQKVSGGGSGCLMYIGDVIPNTAGVVTPIPKIEKTGTDKFKFTVATADTKLYTCNVTDGFPEPTNVAVAVHTGATVNWTKELTFAALQTTPTHVQCYRPGSYPSEVIEITKDFGA